MKLDSEIWGYPKKPAMLVSEHGNSKTEPLSFSLPNKIHLHQNTEPVCSHCYSAALLKARQK